MGDFSANFHRPDTGIHTVEGNVAGARAAQLEKKRQQEQEEFERQKKLRQQQQNKDLDFHSRFASSAAASQQEKDFRAKTVGLVSADDFVKFSNEKEDEKLPETSAAAQEQEKKEAAAAAKRKRKRKLKEKKKMLSTLSFGDELDPGEEEEEEETLVAKKKKQSLKDPTVDTSFLPDQAREEEKEAERQRLEKLWKENQEILKKEKLEITYSYWDGSGHRRTVEVAKGDTVGVFLQRVLKDLRNEFSELRKVTEDDLLYVKEDLILPHDLTFYDLIVTKARGKSGPLFHFDVHEDIRMQQDVRVEKDESHPGKVVERRWYDRNQHIFPASRWEIFDPSKEYGSYTIRGPGKSKKSS